MIPFPSLSAAKADESASWGTLLTVHIVRLEELCGMLRQRRLAVEVSDVEIGSALTAAVDELDAQVTDAKIAQAAKVSAWRLTVPRVLTC